MTNDVHYCVRFSDATSFPSKIFGAYSPSYPPFGTPPDIHRFRGPSSDRDQSNYGQTSTQIGLRKRENVIALLGVEIRSNRALFCATKIAHSSIDSKKSRYRDPLSQDNENGARLESMLRHSSAIS